MDTSLFCFFQVFLLVSAAITSHASLPAQVYWQTKLPNTPMPSAIRDLLRPDVGEEKVGTSVQVGKGGVHVDAGKGKGGNTAVGVGKDGVQVDAGKGTPGGTAVDVGHKGGVNVNAGHGKTQVGVGKGGVGVATGHKGHPVVVRVAPGKSPFNYVYAAEADQLHDDPNVAFFFLEKDLHAGAKMTLRFSKSDSDGSTFLPRSAAESIPFSSSKLPEILHKFSIEPDSVEAETMKNTLESCEGPAAKGESKYCATSLESMVDFAASKLGKNTKPLITTVAGKERESSHEVYTITSGVGEVGSSKSVSCHKEAYAYAVYYCHETHDTKAYVVPMVGKDGRKVEAVAVCHKDTSGWNPKHLAFQVLKVTPGSVPVCHFLPEDHIVWVAAH
ncbi:BURP domain protein RD22-like [Aristolochia californica]|uniref:BURP domain protein RD22-like n=1 Tax=Aristolochia californica TaxID=171875 RepID=UPI0035DCAF97